jgi:serine/threonine-protein kinase RsbW
VAHHGKALGQQGESTGAGRVDPDRVDAGCDVADLHLAAVPAVATTLTAVRRALADWATGTPLRPEQVEAVCLASYEALANVVEHAYRPGRPGVLDVHAACRTQSGTVTVTVIDHGRWLPRTVGMNSLRGRGLPLIHGLADHADITTGAAGTTVRMTWTIPAQTPARSADRRADG